MNKNQNVCMNRFYLYHNLRKSILSVLFIIVMLFGSKNIWAQKEDALSYMSNDDEYNLTIASLRGDYNVVSALLEKGLNANLVLEESITPLTYAAQGGNIRIAKLLISNGADVNLRPRNGHTPLCAATKHKQLNMVDFLIEQGAIIDLSNDLGRTPIIYAAANGDSAIITHLINKKANINYRDTTGCNALLAAVSMGNVEIAEMLLLKGADANSADNLGVTPIMIAAANMDYNMLNLLLAFDANINAITKHKQSALTLAFEGNDESFIQYLIEKGADINQKLTCAESPITVAKYFKTDVFVVENLEMAGAKQNMLPNFRKFFIGPVISFNNNDFISGLQLGFSDFKYDIDVVAGFMIRPMASRILIKDDNNEYYQFWERRNYIIAGIDKKFLLNINKYKHRQGIYIGAKGLYSFTNYRGVKDIPANKITFAPEFGFYYSTNMFNYGISYAYTDFGNEGIAAHKINASLKFNIGRAYSFKKENYKIWE